MLIHHIYPPDLVLTENTRLVGRICSSCFPGPLLEYIEFINELLLDTCFTKISATRQASILETPFFMEIKTSWFSPERTHWPYAALCCGIFAEPKTFWVRIGNVDCAKSLIYDSTFVAYLESAHWFVLCVTRSNIASYAVLDFDTFKNSSFAPHPYDVMT